MTGAARSREEEAALMVRKTKLTSLQRSLIWGMVARGDRLQDIAYWFGVSPSTVHAIKKANAKHSWGVHEAMKFELPPPGPYQLVQRVEYVRLVDMAAVHTAVITELEDVIVRYRTRANPDAAAPQLHSKH